jgi:hypothetical protein
MPEGLMVHEIGADYVLGGFTVNADLEYAQVHRLRK